MKLGTAHRRAIYASLALVYATGVAWMAVRYGVPGDHLLEDGWRLAQVWLLRAHGGAAMVALLATGSVLGVHIPSGWRLRQSVGSGFAMLAALGVLTVTGWLLYYAPSESLRDWSRGIHMLLGAAAPLALVWHLAARAYFRPRSAARAPRRRAPPAPRGSGG